jgi:hypothetical protein
MHEFLKDIRDLSPKVLSDLGTHTHTHTHFPSPPKSSPSFQPRWSTTTRQRHRADRGHVHAHTGLPVILALVLIFPALALAERHHFLGQHLFALCRTRPVFLGIFVVPLGLQDNDKIGNSRSWLLNVAFIQTTLFELKFDLTPLLHLPPPETANSSWQSKLRFLMRSTFIGTSSLATAQFGDKANTSSRNSVCLVCSSAYWMMRYRACARNYRNLDRVVHRDVVFILI